uniref:Uncharacterized protein n=1 Tax=Otus sunia TaxID=257818 RepID=A0A8C8B580_9STRI
MGIEGNNFPQQSRSAEVKHFVPKLVAVTVTWSELSEARVLLVLNYMLPIYPGTIFGIQF